MVSDRIVFTNFCTKLPKIVIYAHGKIEKMKDICKGLETSKFLIINYLKFSIPTA